MIGLESPSLPGIGLFSGRFPVGALSFRRGEQRKAVAVNASSCFSNSGLGGMSTMLTLPLNNPPMYSTTVFGGVFFPGCGPAGFAFDALPLPFAISSLLPSGVSRTEVGYQPVGMKPIDRLWPRTLTSQTATVLIFALAMNSVRPSGESARLLGVEPEGDCG